MLNPQAPQSVTMVFQNADIFVWCLEHQLGRNRRNLAELKSAGLLCNEVSDLAKQGYEQNYGIADDESLLSLTMGPFRALLAECPQPQAIVFHHSYATSAAAPRDASVGAGFMPYAQYFSSIMLRALDVDHIPFVGSFATGCTGLFSLIKAASSYLAFSRRDPVLCLTSDVRPTGATFDALREKILTSDCCSGFLIGHEKRGFQVLALSYYSSKRELVPLVEIVKRTVKMVRELTDALAIDSAQYEFVLHYPNIFPSAWPMVTNYLQCAGKLSVADGFSERAHCLSSDPMISLAKQHGGKSGRLHVVVNFGSGLHLAVGVFKEESIS